MSSVLSFNAYDFKFGDILNARTAKSEKIFKNLTEEGAG